MTKKESDIWKVYMAKGPLAPSFLDSSENAILDSMKHSKEFEIKKQR